MGWRCVYYGLDKRYSREWHNYLVNKWHPNGHCPGDAMKAAPGYIRNLAFVALQSYYARKYGGSYYFRYSYGSKRGGWFSHAKGWVRVWVYTNKPGINSGHIKSATSELLSKLRIRTEDNSRPEIAVMGVIKRLGEIADHGLEHYYDYPYIRYARLLRLPTKVIVKCWDFSPIRNIRVDRRMAHDKDHNIRKMYIEFEKSKNKQIDDTINLIVRKFNRLHRSMSGSTGPRATFVYIDVNKSGRNKVCLKFYVIGVGNGDLADKYWRPFVNNIINQINEKYNLLKNTIQTSANELNRTYANILNQRKRLEQLRKEAEQTKKTAQQTKQTLKKYVKTEAQTTATEVAHSVRHLQKVAGVKTHHIHSQSHKPTIRPIGSVPPKIVKKDDTNDLIKYGALGLAGGFLLSKMKGGE